MSSITNPYNFDAMDALGILKPSYPFKNVHPGEEFRNLPSEVLENMHKGCKEDVAAVQLAIAAHKNDNAHIESLITRSGLSPEQALEKGTEKGILNIPQFVEALQKKCKKNSKQMDAKRTRAEREAEELHFASVNEKDNDLVKTIVEMAHNAAKKQKTDASVQKITRRLGYGLENNRDEIHSRPDLKASIKIHDTTASAFELISNDPKIPMEVEFSSPDSETNDLNAANTHSSQPINCYSSHTTASSIPTSNVQITPSPSSTIPYSNSATPISQTLINTPTSSSKSTLLSPSSKKPRGADAQITMSALNGDSLVTTPRTKKQTPTIDLTQTTLYNRLKNILGVEKFEIGQEVLVDASDDFYYFGKIINKENDIITVKWENCENVDPESGAETFKINQKDKKVIFKIMDRAEMERVLEPYRYYCRILLRDNTEKEIPRYYLKDKL